MSEWQATKLKDLCEKVTVGHVGSMADDYQSHGITFLRSLNIKPFSLDLCDVKFISNEFHSKLRKSALHPGDVVVVRTGYPGTAAVIPKSLPISNCSDLVIIRPGNGLNPYFITAIFNSAFGQTLVSGNTVGAAQQHFNITVAKELRFQIPPKPLQDKIAAILSAYDELIENNQRRIALLEKMAEEIYREWFVRLRFPGHDKVKFVKGVPEGWRAVKFTEICVFQKGKTPDQTFFENQDGLLPYITVEFLEGKKTEYVLKKRNSIVSENGDVLMLMDGARSGLVFRGKKGVVGSTFARVSVEPLYRDVVYEFLRATREHIVSNNTGSAIPHANKEFIHRLVMFLPENGTLIEKFNTLYRSLFEQMLNLVSQNELLLRSRDALLPRLISGKISVENLDIQFPPGMAEDALTPTLSQRARESR